MSLLDLSAVEIVEQLAIRPVSRLPAHRMAAVEKLIEQGVIERQDNRWRLTKVGLILLGHALQESWHPPPASRAPKSILP